MKNCNKMDIRDKMTLMYIWLLFSIDCNTFIFLVCIMRSASEVVSISGKV